MTDDRHEDSLGRGREPVGAAIEPSLLASAEMAVAMAMIDVTRELAQSVPSPRGAPYFGLDVGCAFDLQVLDAFCTRGIFRKYEFALDLGSGLGGRARWLAARSGCRVVGVDPNPATVAAATMLNRRARMDSQVTFQAGRADQLPLRGRVFTHVWIIVADPQADLTAWFPEAFRVLRPGAHFAVQCPAPSPARQRGLLDELRDIGFIELERRDVVLPEVPPAWRLARDRWQRTLPRMAPAVAARWDVAPHPLEPHCVQLFARRPA